MKLMKKLRFFVSMVCAALFVAGCGCSGDGVVVDKPARRKTSTGEKWTVMIYMSASSSEEKYGRASEVLNSLSFDFPENVNVVVETGGCSNWNIEDIKNDKLQDFEVQKNGLRLIEEKPLANMGEAGTYADFLNRTIKKYPADRYMSVIWGDGGNMVLGVANDATHKYDALTPSEIAGALASTETKLDIIGFDAGMMATLEVAAKLVPYADYMVASQDIMPASGWDYRQLFSFLSENPSAGSAYVAQIICDGVKENVWEEYEDIVSMSVIDLSDVTNLMQDFDSLAWGMSTDAENIYKLRAITAQMENVKKFGAATVLEGYTNMVDLESLADSVYGAIKADYANIDRAISNAVIYRVSGKLHKDSCGINVYYPIRSTAAEINAYKEMGISSGYNQFLDKITIKDNIKNRSADYKETASYKAYETLVNDYTITAEPDLNGKYLLKASTRDIIKKVSVRLYKYDEEEGIYLYLASGNDVAYSNITRAYEYELKNKQLELNGIPVSAYLVNNSRGVKIYSIPVIYEEEISSIRVAEREKDEEKTYEVLGLWMGTDEDTGITGRRYKKLSAGDSIIPLYEAYGDVEGKYVKGKRLKLVFGGLNVKEKSLDDGEYLLSFVTEDIYGKKTESNTTNVTAIKGKMQISK